MIKVQYVFIISCRLDKNVHSNIFHIYLFHLQDNSINKYYASSITSEKSAPSTNASVFGLLDNSNLVSNFFRSHKKH